MCTLEDTIVSEPAKHPGAHPFDRWGMGLESASPVPEIAVSPVLPFWRCRQANDDRHSSNLKSNRGLISVTNSFGDMGKISVASEIQELATKSGNSSNDLLVWIFGSFHITRAILHLSLKDDSLFSRVVPSNY